MGIRKYILLSLGIICWHSLCGQSTLSGRVLSEQGSPVSFASIKWKTSASGIAEAYAIGDAQGVYRLSISTELTGFIEVSAIGFQMVTVPVSKGKVPEFKLDIVLVRLTKELETVTIRNRPSITISGDTTSYLVDRFKRGNENNVSELLSNIPGFTVGGNGTIIYNGKIIERVLINGEDLTGKNYRALTRNLDPGGIDQMQVIKGYTDGTNILSSLTEGDEQVLNIVYKSGWLQQIFGTADAGIGPPFTSYNGGIQALGLFNKAKGVFIQRLNNTGSTNIDPGNSIIPEDLQIDPLYNVGRASYPPVSSVNDISTGLQDVDALDRNKTSLSMLSLLLKPLKKLTTKGRFDFSTDNYHQLMVNSLTYISAAPQVRIDQENSVTRRLRSIRGTLLFNYHLNGSNQLLLLLNGSRAKNRSLAENIIDTEQKTEELRQKVDQAGVKIIYNRLFRNDFAFSVQGSYLEGRLPITYSIAPASFSDLLEPSPTNSILSQYSDQPFHTYIGQLMLVKKFRRYTLSYLFDANNTKEKLSNTISHIEPAGEIFIPQDSTNNTRNSLLVINNTLRNAWKFSSSISATFSATFSYYRNTFDDYNKNILLPALEGVRFLPSIAFNVKLNKNAQLNASYNYANRFMETSTIGNGVVVRNLFTVSRNVDTLQRQLSSTAQLSYFFNDLMLKHLYVYSVLSYSETPLFYIPRITPHSGYTFMEFMPTGKSMEMLFLTLGVQKLSKDFRQKINPVVSIVQGYNYRLVGDNEQRTKFTQLYLALLAEKEIQRTRVKSKLEYVVTQQTFSQKIYNQQWTASVAANWKASNQFFLDAKMTCYLIHPYHQSSKTFLNSEASVLFQPANSKWTFSLRASNLLNQSVYRTAILSPISTSVTSYQLFPRVILASVKYRF